MPLTLKIVEPVTSYGARLSWETRVRQSVERLVIEHLVKNLIANGLYVSLSYDGGETFEVTKTRNANDIMKHIMACDEEHLFVYDDEGTHLLGWIFLVYGNGGWDVISDYSTRLEDDVKPTWDQIRIWEGE